EGGGECGGGGGVGERHRVHLGCLPGWWSRSGLPRLTVGGQPVGALVKLPCTGSPCCNTNTDATCSERHRSADGSFARQHDQQVRHLGRRGCSAAYSVKRLGWAMTRRRR